MLEEGTVVAEAGRKRVHGSGSADIPEREHRAVSLEQREGPVVQGIPELDDVLLGRVLGRSLACEETGGRRCGIDRGIGPAAKQRN